jgi:hypothetical protein
MKANPPFLPQNRALNGILLHFQRRTTTTIPLAGKLNPMASCLNTNTAYYIIRFKSPGIFVGGIVTSKSNKKSTNTDFFLEFCVYNVESLNSPVVVS